MQIVLVSPPRGCRHGLTQRPHPASDLRVIANQFAPNRQKIDTGLLQGPPMLRLWCVAKPITWSCIVLLGRRRG